MTFNPSPHWAHWTVPEFLAALPQKPDEDLTDYHYRLWKLKPSPIKKAYGSQGPTPEQAAFHADRVKKWNKAWRALTKHMKAKAEAEAYRSSGRDGKKTVTRPTHNPPPRVKGRKFES